MDFGGGQCCRHCTRPRSLGAGSAGRCYVRICACGRRRVCAAGRSTWLPLPSMGITEVATALRFVAGGGTYIPTSVLSDGVAVPKPTPEAIADGHDFSPRQLQVLRLLREGKPNKIIAHELGMSEATVKAHLRVIMRRLH